jgi:putative spermidine/putrescine transport system permease protein
VIAFVVVLRLIRLSILAVDRRLEQAALSLGATPWGTFRQVTLPLILPGVLVGALFAFITSFDEVIVALFLSGSGAVTLPRRMWVDLRFAIDPTIAAVSTLTIVLTAAILGACMCCADAATVSAQSIRPEARSNIPDQITDA